jgi:hypothetical protein
MSHSRLVRNGILEVSVQRGRWKARQALADDTMN